MDQFPKALRTKIINHLRRIGYLNVTYKAAMQSAHKGFSEWECRECKSIGKRSDLHGDHIEPVVETSVGFIDWNTYMDRLFLGAIQPLCITCHKRKTKNENEVRRKVQDR